MNKSAVNNKKDFKIRARFSFFLALEKILSEVSERPSGIIKERYGIKTEKPKTLEEIGREYKITRERVRQIIRETIKKIKKIESEFLDEAEDELRFTIKEKNGIIREDKLIFGELESKERGAMKFFLELVDSINFKEISGELDESWALEEFDISEWRKVKNEIKEVLEKVRKPLTDQDLLKELKKTQKTDVGQKKLFDYLDVSSEIKKGNFGKWGLKVWDEINPKGTREKIYLVLKETGKPVHFKEIARLIDEHKLGKKKKTHPQTVHNELIRDKRFILVGRGIYALSEWGYKKGTVKEVIQDILEKNSQPMEREDIMNKILEMRKVKKTTILINLNNFFERVEKNKYSIKK